ncbi:PASTA domain-containing protein, partial [PVC group bacterium]|nr:PASTA domain-containing protein [PVC group bacterium]
AKEILTEAGLTYEIRKMTQAYYAPRGIYEWSPKKFAYEGDVIQVDIEYPEVPQLRGMTKEQAILAIKNASLKPDVQVIDIVYENPGVYAQEPPAGTLLIKNSTVKARVAIVLH